MIPQIIHYCWFGKTPMSPLVEKCINSWRRFMPQYQIMRWDESNFDINASAFMKDAYRTKMYAFVSDYARYKILESYGGIFLDSDVELIKKIDIIGHYPAMFAINKHVKKNVCFVNPGLFMASEAHFPLLKEVLSYYDSIRFISNENKPCLNFSSPRILTSILVNNYGFQIYDKDQILKNEIQILNSDYFDPINPRKLWGKKLDITEYTYAIHHGAASWIPRKKKIAKNISIISRTIFGDKIVDLIKGKEKIL